MKKEIKGKIYKIDDTKTFGTNGFRKREVVIATDEQYSQLLLIEFIQDNCDLLDTFKIEQEVVISINFRGREWVSPEGEVKYFNSIQGWKIECIGQVVEEVEEKTFVSEINDDLPF